MLMILVAEAAVAIPDDVADAGGCIDGTAAASGSYWKHKRGNIVGSVQVCHTPVHDAATEAAVLM